MSENHTHLTHEDRIKTVEIWMSTHDAVCRTRYENILDKTSLVSTQLSDLTKVTQRRIDYMLIGLFVMAFAIAFGPQIVEHFLLSMAGRNAPTQVAPAR
jgi:hypothetical protein